MTKGADASTVAQDRTMRLIFWKITPFLFCCFVAAYQGASMSASPN